MNSIGRFGGTISTYSSRNTLGSHPPVVVDHQGKFYGELTVNTIRPRRITDPGYLAWLGAVCHARTATVSQRCCTA